MANTRHSLERVNHHLQESVGVRSADSRPQLSPIASSRDVGRRANRQFGKIDIDRIQPDPDQPRVEFDEVALQQLADSLRDKGQLAPIRVRWSDELLAWVIISGERRCRAAKLAGLTTVDCFFQEQPLSPTQILEEQLIENLLREDLKPIEEAESYQHLMQVTGWNGKQLASALNVNPTRISRAIALLKLPHEMRTRIDSGEISARAGYELSKLPEASVAKVSQQVDAKNLTAAKARSTVRQRTGTATTRGCRQTFISENGFRVIVQSSRKGSYHDIEQALLIALEEVRTRIDNRVQIL